MIRHFSHRLDTDADTFMVLSIPSPSHDVARLPMARP